MGSHIPFFHFARGKSLSFFPILQRIDLFVIPFWHGIRAAAPERIAPKDPPDSQSGAAKNTPFSQRLKGILGAGWGKPAAPGFYGRDEFPIQVYRKGEHRYGGAGDRSDDFLYKINHGAMFHPHRVRSWKAASRPIARHVLRPAFLKLLLSPVRL